MSWTKLAPIAKTTGRPMASATIVVLKDGVPKISLILSASLKDEFGDPTRADVLAGEGEYADCVRLEFRPDGDFDVRGFVHGGARIFLPVPDGLPRRACANAPCAVVEKQVRNHDVLIAAGQPAEFDSVVLRLPVEDWTRVAPPANRGTAPAPPPPAPTGPPKVGNGAPLDVAEYLTGKGVKCARLAGERFQLNGEVVQFGAVLKAVNDHRAGAGLDPLARTQVR
ncbi:hypothetical protein [Phenylobacterium sp.]|jgi:hypothetical protein|uniref:hypothetical protein n=1 Tax=Phenylobacterium sp. TaxID=1871053 RepID=UPI002F41C1A8